MEIIYLLFVEEKYVFQEQSSFYIRFDYIKKKELHKDQLFLESISVGIFKLIDAI